MRQGEQGKVTGTPRPWSPVPAATPLKQVILDSTIRQALAAAVAEGHQGVKLELTHGGKPFVMVVAGGEPAEKLLEKRDAGVFAGLVR